MSIFTLNMVYEFLVSVWMCRFARLCNKKVHILLHNLHDFITLLEWLTIDEKVMQDSALFWNLKACTYAEKYARGGGNIKRESSLAYWWNTY